MPYPGMEQGPNGETVILPSGTPSVGQFLGVASVSGVQIVGQWSSVSLTGLLVAANNLSDVANPATTRSNLGALGGSLGSTDNRILRSDGTGGATAQGSAVTIDDSGAMSGVASLTFGNQGILDATGGYSRWMDYGTGFQVGRNGSPIIVGNASASSSSLGTSNYVHVPNLQADGNLTASGTVQVGSGPRFKHDGFGTMLVRNSADSGYATLFCLDVGATSAVNLGANGDIALKRQAAGVARLDNYAGTAGVSLDISTDGTLKVRNRGNSADGNLTAGNLTASGNASLTNTSLLTFGTAVTDVLIKKGASQKLYVRCGDDSGFADLFWRNSEAQNNGYIGWTGRSILKSPSDGRVNFWNYAETDYSDVYVKGLTTSGTGSFGGTVTVGASTFAALPSASANTGAILRVTDRGQKLVHSDGTDWRFVHDNTIAS